MNPGNRPRVGVAAALAVVVAAAAIIVAVRTGGHDDGSSDATRRSARPRLATAAGQAATLASAPFRQRLAERRHALDDPNLAPRTPGSPGRTTSDRPTESACVPLMGKPIAAGATPDPPVLTDGNIRWRWDNTQFQTWDNQDMQIDGCDTRAEAAAEIAAGKANGQVQGKLPMHFAIPKREVIQCTRNGHIAWTGPIGTMDDAEADICNYPDKIGGWSVQQSLSDLGMCSHCDLSGMEIDDFDFIGPSRAVATYEPFTFYATSFAGATIRNSSFTDLQLVDVDFDGATIVDTTFRGSAIIGGSFGHGPKGEAARLVRTTLPSVLSDVTFDGTAMTGLTWPGPAPNAFGVEGLYGCTSFGNTVVTPDIGIDVTALRADPTVDVVAQEWPITDFDPLLPRVGEPVCGPPFDGAAIDIDQIPGGKGRDLTGVGIVTTDATWDHLAGKDLSGARLARATFVGPRPSLAGATLSGANLTAMDLHQMDLSPTDPKGPGIRLDRAVLDEADLSGASLRAADLRGAQLYGTKFTEADLSGANLTNARASSPTNQTASVATAVFDRAYATNATFGSMVANRVSFRGAHLFGAPVEFGGAQLDGAIFTGSRLGGARFVGAALDDAHFDEAVCAACTFDQASLARAKFNRSILAGPTFANVLSWSATDFTDATVDFTGTPNGSTQRSYPFKVAPFETPEHPSYKPSSLPTDANLKAIAACPNGKPPAEITICADYLATRQPLADETCTSAGPFACPATIDRWPSTPVSQPVAVARSRSRNLTVILTQGGTRLQTVGVTTTSMPTGLSAATSLTAMADGTFLATDPAGNRVWRLDVSPEAGTATATAYAGTGAAGSAGDGGPATAATLDRPAAAVGLADGAAAIATRDGRLRRVTADGVITTAATGLGDLTALAADPMDRLYALDAGGGRVLRIDHDGTVTVLAGGAPSPCTLPCPGTGYAFGTPTGLAVVRLGSTVADDGLAPLTVLVSDAGTHTVDRLAANGVMEAPLAGDGSATAGGDGGRAAAAGIADPGGLWADADGRHVYLLDGTGLRRITLP